MPEDCQSIIIRGLCLRHYVDNQRWPPSLRPGRSCCFHCELHVCFSLESGNDAEEFHPIWQIREINFINWQCDIVSIMYASVYAMFFIPLVVIPAIPRCLVLTFACRSHKKRHKQSIPGEEFRRISDLSTQIEENACRSRIWQKSNIPYRILLNDRTVPQHER